MAVAVSTAPAVMGQALRQPAGLALDDDGVHLWVSDTNNHAVLQVRREDGAITRQFGCRSEDDGHGNAADARDHQEDAEIRSYRPDHRRPHLPSQP